MFLCSWQLYSINNGTDMSIIFCEFSLFVNIKYLHNIRDNKLNQAFLIYFFDTEKLTDRVLWNCQPKFNGIVLGLWPILPQTFMKIGAILFEISWWQTNKHRWKHNLLAQGLSSFYFFYIGFIIQILESWRNRIICLTDLKNPYLSLGADVVLLPVDHLFPVQK